MKKKLTTKEKSTIYGIIKRKILKVFKTVFLLLILTCIGICINILFK